MVALLIAAATGALAADAVTGTTQADDASISAAKRDFDSLRAARDKALQPKGDVPRFDMPELQTTSPTLRSTKTAKEKELEAKMKKKSANWLLDAMEKEPDSRKTPERERVEKNEELERLFLGPKETDKTNLMTAAEPAAAPAEKEPKKVEPPPNPLNQFLSGWMTPQDFALLKPGLQSSGASAVALPQADNSVSAPISVDPGNSVRMDALGSLAGPGRSGVGQSSTPAENPYVQLMMEPAPFAGFMLPLAPTIGPTMATPPAPIFTPAPAPPPPPSSKIPDFVRPATDDKYFKPLKRF